MFDISSKNITRYLKSGIKILLENPKKAKDLSWATWIHQNLPILDSNNGFDIKEMEYATSSLNAFLWEDDDLYISKTCRDGLFGAIGMVDNYKEKCLGRRYKIDWSDPCEIHNWIVYIRAEKVISLIIGLHNQDISDNVLNLDLKDIYNDLENYCNN